MRATSGLTNEALVAALDDALADPAKRTRLYEKLCVASGLPGTRANLVLAEAFAVECAARGQKADALAFALATMSAEEAPGATAKEFLPVVGVVAIGARLASTPKDAKLKKRVMALLHDAAEDTRFRVREAVPLALARIGEATGDVLVHELGPWMDGFFHAAAVLLAMGDKRFLGTLDDADIVVERLDEAYALAKNAPRSAVRWPGWKALVEALSTVPAALAARFGVRIFDRLVAWSNTEIPELRDAVEKNIRGGSGVLAGRHQDEIVRVRKALEASKTPPRDPTIIVHGTRGRGKKRRR